MEFQLQLHISSSFFLEHDEVYVLSVLPSGVLISSASKFGPAGITAYALSTLVRGKIMGFDMIHVNCVPNRT